MNIKVSIVDDHPMVIAGLTNMLSECTYIELIATYPDGETLLQELEQLQPDVLLLDIQLPGKNGDELAPIILKKYPDMRLLALTNFNSILYIQNMRMHGVLGYLLKTTQQSTLIQAIETVYRGEEFLEPSLKDKIVQVSSKKQKISYSIFTKTKVECKKSYDTYLTQKPLKIFTGGLSRIHS